MSQRFIPRFISGDKFYQQHARKALPLLVRQARARSPITYKDLAIELKMPNPRNLNYVLGAIGNELDGLLIKSSRVPPIQCLVVNQKTREPGHGIVGFLSKSKDFATLPIDGRQQVLERSVVKVYRYHYWGLVLRMLGLEESANDVELVIQAAGNIRGGVESSAHRRLKEFVASNPEAVGIHKGFGRGRTEVPLPSGDCLDVLFCRRDDYVAVEVKSARSADSDILRGLFQCVKYRAVMRAQSAVQNKAESARVILVLEGCLPARLRPVKNLLSVETLENISPG